MASESLHERFEDLSTGTRDLHRAITSLMEELEAVDWYQQRVDAAGDEDLKQVLAHNRDEEIEHAMMNLEWIRRRIPTFDTHARTYLFSDGPITAVEKAAKEDGGEAAGESGAPAEPKKRGSLVDTQPGSAADGSLGIGSLKLA